MGDARDFEVIVIGAGFGGVAAVIELKKRGFERITVLDAASGLGGTWRHNTYPGAACDVPSHLYSYSFAQRPRWSRFCSPQKEILAYLEEVANTHDVTRHVRTNTRVKACRWSDSHRRWTVEIENGAPLEADAVVIATGQLNRPAYPKIPGIEDFAGHSFHSARWDHDYDLTGKRVAVVGTGASAVQFIPEIAPKVGSLTVFQRTGNWFMPRNNTPYAPAVAALLERSPEARLAWRAGLFVYIESLTAMIRNPTTLGRIGALQSTLFMNSQIKDPELRKRLWPNYPFGCKRVVFSSHFLPALQRPNVSVVTEEITRMTARGPETATGVHEVDAIVYGTGFHANEFMFPMDIVGAGGRSLRDAWATGPKAHLGITMTGFPSLFVMYGPNTNTSGGSIIFFLEAQAKYLAQGIALTRDEGAAFEVREDVETASVARLQERFAGTAWLDCNSWYRNQEGRIITNWPGYMREYARAVERFDPAEYRRI